MTTLRLKFSTTNDIILDNHSTGLKVTQRQEGTVVYTPEIYGKQRYQEHAMPRARYSLAHPKPASGAAGVLDF